MSDIKIPVPEVVNAGENFPDYHHPIDVRVLPDGALVINQDSREHSIYLYPEQVRALRDGLNNLPAPAPDQPRP